MTIETLDGRMIDTIALTIFQGRLRGDLLTPQAPTYAELRHLVNARFDSRPALIVRAKDAYDVMHAVSFAREYGLEIAVRSGGHSIPGHSTGDGVLMIDLSGMKQITIAADRHSARVQPGVTNGELVAALDAQALTTTTGTCASVGMGGSSLGGGIGWMMGRFGATVDNILEFEVVTADARVLTVNAEQHPDLFWALRGGGGNFGIVTSFTYKTYPLGPIFGGMAIFPQAAAPLVLRMYRHLSSTAPDELISHAVLTDVPNFGPAVLVQAIYSGANMAEGERVLAPLRNFGPPAIDLFARRSYTEAYMMLTPPIPPQSAWHDTAYTLRRLTDAALDDMVLTAAERPSPLAAVIVHQIHGAATRVAPDATAFALREPHYAVANVGLWVEGTGAAEQAWTQAALKRMAPHAGAGTYVNFLGDDGDNAIRATYRANYNRLATIKAAYDPENIFRRNQNIQPA